jgi:hypothetical protein
MLGWFNDASETGPVSPVVGHRRRRRGGRRQAGIGEGEVFQDSSYLPEERSRLVSGTGVAFHYPRQGRDFMLTGIVFALIAVLGYVLIRVRRVRKARPASA